MAALGNIHATCQVFMVARDAHQQNRHCTQIGQTSLWR